ncbi:MAG: hypothetical protein ABFR82_15595 [Nitrospirota bacterium]
MNEHTKNILEKIQKIIVKMLATSREGRNLHLIGGYRFRLLDNSPRLSMDVDYHSSEDLEQKRNGLISLFREKLLPQVKEQLGYDGNVGPATGPDTDTSLVKTADLAFYIKDFRDSRIEISVDILKIEALDEPVPRTTDGVVYLTRSDLDMIESKVITLLNSVYVRDRDIVDIFLFEDKFAKNSPERIAQKLTELGINSSMVTKQINKLLDARDIRIRGVAAVIEDQLDPEAADNINMGGGAKAVFTRVMEILTDKLKLIKGDKS